MNEKSLLRGAEMLEQSATSVVTRRTVVKTGVKLAYVVPLVAASFKLSGVGSALADGCDTCDDALSTKPLEGGCYTCKSAGSGCLPTQGSAQAADIDPQNAGGLVCICQSRTCTVAGVEYQKDDNITVLSNGACKPQNVAGTPVCNGHTSPR